MLQKCLGPQTTYLIAAQNFTLKNKFLCCLEVFFFLKILRMYGNKQKLVDKGLSVRGSGAEWISGRGNRSTLLETTVCRRRNEPATADAGCTTAELLYHECIMCVCVHTHTHTYICKRTFMCKYISRNVYICVYRCLCIFLWTVLKAEILYTKFL